MNERDELIEQIAAAARRWVECVRGCEEGDPIGVGAVEFAEVLARQELFELAEALVELEAGTPT